MNPDLDKAREGTQFKTADGRKRGGDKAWSIRGQMRYIAAQQIDVTAPNALEELFGKKPTNAQRAAFNAVLKTVKDEGDIRAIEIVDDRIDGKLPQTTINAEWEQLKRLSDDELISILTTGLTEIAPAGRSDEGSAAPGTENQETGTAEATSPAPEVSGTVDTGTA